MCRRIHPSAHGAFGVCGGFCSLRGLGCRCPSAAAVCPAAAVLFGGCAAGQPFYFKLRGSGGKCAAVPCCSLADNDLIKGRGVGSLALRWGWLTALGGGALRWGGRQGRLSVSAYVVAWEQLRSVSVPSLPPTLLRWLSFAAAYAAGTTAAHGAAGGVPPDGFLSHYLPFRPIV